MAYNTIIVLVGASLLGMTAGVTGSFAILRQRSLTGDVLGHAALPGICIAFLVVGQKRLEIMLIFALIFGLLGVALISWLPRVSRTKSDAAMGIVLGSFFALGIALSRIIQSQTTGGSKSGLDAFLFGKPATLLFREVVVIAAVSLFTLAMIILLFPKFKTVTFDFDFAKTQFLRASTIDFLMLFLLALVVVTGLPAVGAILVAALVIIPGAAARFWTERMSRMLILAGAFGMLIGALGTLLSSWYGNLPAGALIVLIGSLIFAISMFAAPRRGILSQMLKQRKLRREVDLQTMARTVSRLTRQLGESRHTSSVELRQELGWTRNRFDPITRIAYGRGLMTVIPTVGWRLTVAGRKLVRELDRAEQTIEHCLTARPELCEEISDLDLLRAAETANLHLRTVS